MAATVPAFDIDKASEAQRAAAQEIQQDRNQAGQPLGAIWSCMMDSPGAARRIARVGAHCRFDSALSEQQREVAILAAAYAIGFDLESSYHEQYAARLGVPAPVLAALKQGNFHALPPDMRCIAELSRAVASGFGADSRSAPLAAVRKQFSPQTAVDVVTIAGYYVMLHRVSQTLMA